MPLCRISYALATGIWEDAAFANYVSIVEHGNNRMVGWLEGLEGLCSLFFAIPFGTLADSWRRDRVLRISSCMELGALASLKTNSSPCKQRFVGGRYCTQIMMTLHLQLSFSTCI